ncbi:MAG TPA: ATP-binding SpoIIE family protein phosphatase [Acidimicrobiales bacterium]|nr:ATP-binding SpoIIE family protein phosphatase [Acidimicrobiales bacterium]
MVEQGLTITQYADALARVELLDGLSNHLGTSADPGAVVERLADRVANRFGNCAVWLRGEESLKLAALRPPVDVDGDNREAGDQGTGSGSGSGSGTRAPARTAPGRGIAPGRVPEGRIALAGGTAVARAYRTSDLQIATTPPVAGSAMPATVVTVPMLAGGTVHGVLQLAGDRPLGADDVSLALAVAARGGRALANALRFQQQQAVLDAFEGPTVPTGLRLPGLDVEAYHRRDRYHHDAGATWYDAIELEDGFLFFSLGRVTGGRAAAAVLMAQVRGAMRAYVVDYPSPAAVLSGLDRLFDVLRERRPVTTVAGIADPATGEVWLANAGHPLPLLVPASGPVVPVGAARSAALGSRGRIERPEHRLVLGRGDTLLVHTGNPSGATALARQLMATGPGGAGEHLDRWVAGVTALIADGPPTGREGGVATLAVRYRGDRRRRPMHPAAEDRNDRPPAGSPPRLQLPPLVASATAARRWLAEQLDDLPGELVDTATFLTSELVTNAVLHAGTDVVVSLHRGEERVRVDVADGDPGEPILKGYGPDAATGRGLTLFDRLASAWGTRPIIPSGKIVWFELPVDIPGQAAETSALPFDLDAWSDPVGLAVAAEPRQHGPAVQIRLLGVPVAALNRASEQYEALFREFRLVVEQGPSNPGGAPERLIALIDELGTRFAGFTAGVDEEWRAALRQGDPSTDLLLPLPVEVAAACEHYDQLLDQADHFCRAAELITLPATPEAVALRKWFLLEFSRQAAGETPIPWPDSPWGRNAGSTPGPAHLFAPLRGSLPPKP